MRTPWNPTGCSTLAEAIAEHAKQNPDMAAFISDDRFITWKEYDNWTTHLASQLLSLDLDRGDRVGVLLPDSWEVHIAFVACEKSGLVAVGISPRAGLQEATYLLRRANVKVLISKGTLGGISFDRLLPELDKDGQHVHHIVLAGRIDEHGALSIDGQPARPLISAKATAAIEKRRMRPEELSLLNSTSGTTGMPKLVTQNQKRWISFAEEVYKSAPLSREDIFLCAVPASVGFGLWSGHFIPTLLGATTVLLPKFSVEKLFQAIQTHRVSILSAVSTQLVMMANHPEIKKYDLSSLKIKYTGGEAVPYSKALEFEELTGATVLQFYGSNEAGPISGTSVQDSTEKRLTTAGRFLGAMEVRLIDDNGLDVTATRRGRPICKGPFTSDGYYQNPEANTVLYTSDGWMKVDDIVEIDNQGFVKIIGRSGDFIIRGGKNISAAAVESAVMSCPGVELAAAVSMPDSTFGERVCIYVKLSDNTSITLKQLANHLLDRGISKENIPERLEVRNEFPIVSGGKIDKKALRKDIREKLAAEIPDQTSFS